MESEAKQNVEQDTAVLLEKAKKYEQQLERARKCMKTYYYNHRDEILKKRQEQRDSGTEKKPRGRPRVMKPIGEPKKIGRPRKYPDESTDIFIKQDI